MIVSHYHFCDYFHQEYLSLFSIKYFVGVFAFFVRVIRCIPIHKVSSEILLNFQMGRITIKFGIRCSIQKHIQTSHCAIFFFCTLHKTFHVMIIFKKTQKSVLILFISCITHKPYSLRGSIAFWHPILASIILRQGDCTSS